MPFYTHKIQENDNVMYHIDTSVSTNNGNRPDSLTYNKRRKEMILIKIGIIRQDKYRISPWRKM